MIEIVEYLQHFQRPVEIFKEHVNTGLAGLTIRGLLNAYLISMVRFDNDQGKYILDLSVEDAEYLGIDEKYYVEVKNMVEKMNE